MILSLGTSICCRCGLKKKENKKDREREREAELKVVVGEVRGAAFRGGADGMLMGKFKVKVKEDDVKEEGAGLETEV